MAAERLFDVYIVVDWSARSQPSPATPVRDALWVAEHRADADGPERAETYWRTRRACREYLYERLVEHASHDRRVLVGYDFALGYPRGFANAIGLGGTPPWRRVWTEIEARIADGATNENNRFEVAAQMNHRCGGNERGPFWGCPRGRAYAGLLPTSPVFPHVTATGVALPCWRHTDRAAQGVQSVWKLYGQGSVGSQSLLGIPALAALRAAAPLAAISRVWPFETGFVTPRPGPGAGPAIVHAEVWPGLTPLALDRSLAVRDQAQVRATAAWLAALDRANALHILFSPPATLSHSAAAACVDEEGWILGAGLS